MSVKDFNCIIDCKNMTTGEIFKCIDYDEFDSYVFPVTITCSIGSVRLLNSINDCLENNHNILISKSYKNK